MRVLVFVAMGVLAVGCASDSDKNGNVPGGGGSSPGGSGGSSSGGASGNGGNAGEAGTAGSSGSGSGSGAGPGAPLLQSSNMKYLGAFRMPTDDPLGTSSFLYGGRALTPHEGTLFLQGHGQKDGNVGQIEIPSMLGTGSWNSLPEGKVLQGFADVTDGKLGTAGDTYNGMPVYGMLVYDEELIVAVSQAYGSSQEASHGASGLSLANSGDFQGFFPMAAVANLRALGGYMTHVPPEWQSLFGGPALTGNCCLSIIGATSSGPSISVFDPADVGNQNPIPASTLLFYPEQHPSCGAPGCDSTENEMFNLTTRVVGVAFPAGTSSVLFIGGQGTGPYCYGTAIECGDPALPDNKGPHAQPYRHQVWAYDASDLLAVKNGQKQPWEPAPYAIWELPELTSTGVNVQGAGYDPVTRRVYIAQDYASQPKIDVYEIDAP